MTATPRDRWDHSAKLCDDLADEKWPYEVRDTLGRGFAHLREQAAALSDDGQRIAHLRALRAAMLNCLLVVRELKAAVIVLILAGCASSFQDACAQYWGTAMATSFVAASGVILSRAETDRTKQEVEQWAAIDLSEVTVVL
jgi:hypothetical protein